MKPGAIPVAAAVVVVLVALVLPSPDPAVVPPLDTGPARVSDAWPAARTVSLAAELPDGSMLQPLLLQDNGALLALATSPDVSRGRLVLRSTDGALRDLRAYQGPDRPTVAGVARAGSDLLWIETGADESGQRVTTIWRASSTGADVRMIAQDASDLLYFDSGYDLQVADGRVYWAAAASDHRGELRSVPVDGGPVTVRSLPVQYALTAWPWASRINTMSTRDVHLLNLVTGEERTVPAGADEIITCTPAWCRIVTLLSQRQTTGLVMSRGDGTGRRQIAGATLSPLNTDIALLDRFEVLASTGMGDSQRLWLYDLTQERLLLLAAGTATVGSRGPYLWWSTGDNETLMWHWMDLRQLA